MIIKLLISDMVKKQSVFYIYLYKKYFMNKNIKILLGSVVTMYIITVILEFAGVNLFYHLKIKLSKAYRKNLFEY